jgi:hypothetical protein
MLQDHFEKRQLVKNNAAVPMLSLSYVLCLVLVRFIFCSVYGSYFVSNSY